MTTGYVILALLGIVALAVAGFLWDWWRSKRFGCGPMPRHYRDRGPQETLWRSRYGDETFGTVDAVLQMLCEAFMFNPADRFKLAPDDRLRELYRACYPRWKIWNQADSMEIETLVLDLEERFETELPDLYPEISLGDLVELALKKQPGGTGP